MPWSVPDVIERHDVSTCSAENPLVEPRLAAARAWPVAWEVSELDSVAIQRSVIDVATSANPSNIMVNLNFVLVEDKMLAAAIDMSEPCDLLVVPGNNICCAAEAGPAERSYRAQGCRDQAASAGIFGGHGKGQIPWF